MAKLYKDFEKSFNDLHTEDFKFKNVVEVKTDAGNGVSATGSIVVDGDASLALKIKRKDLGFEASTKLVSSGKEELKFSHDKLGVSGLKLSLDGEIAADGSRSGSAGIAYKHARFAFDTKFSGPKTKLASSVSVHQDAFMVGTKFTLADVKKDDASAFGLSAAEAGVHYQKGDFQAVAKVMHSQKDGLQIRGSTFQNLNATTSAGAFIQGKTDATNVTGAVAVSHQYHANTTVKANLNSSAVYQLQIQSQLSSHTKIIACLEGSAASKADANKVGVKLVLS